MTLGWGWGREGSGRGGIQVMGNRIVDFTSLIEAGDGRPLATIEHSSVFQLARERAAEGD